MKSKYIREGEEAKQPKDRWARTKHRLTVSPRALAKEILEELQCGSTPIMRYYEEHGYRVTDNESVEDLIVRTVRAHVIFGEEEE